MEQLGDNLSGVQNITYLVGDSPEDLIKQLASFHLPTRVLYGYVQGSKHYMWVQTLQKIKRSVPKKTKE